ncbi:MAG: Fpg/Nei family DNA glycosylase [Kineosporiaceae bacterium]
MPEGHTLHRLARRHLRTFGGRLVHVTSPQGRFAAGAARLDGTVLRASQAHGKHLFLGFSPAVPGEGDDRDVDTAGPSRTRRPRPDRWLHVHLGLIGTFVFGAAPAPEPRGALRLRIESDAAWADLRGPTACELLTAGEVERIHARLGPDPLRPDADPQRAHRRVRRSTVPLGALLMQQEVVAGVGNVYRAELLYRHRLDPWMPGRELSEAAWEALWGDLVVLMRDGVRRGRIVTTLPLDRPHRSGPVRAGEAHYVYRRTGLPCFVCATLVVAEPMAGRTLYRCPYCQKSQPQ